MLRPTNRLLVISLAVSLGCKPSPAAPDATVLPNVSLGVPAGAPSFVGVVASVQQDGRVVLSRPAPELCERGAIVAIHPDTRLVHRGGAAADARDVRAGQRVSAWFADAELRSCPVQVSADAIVLEP